MLRDLLQRLVDSYVEPRAAVRDVLDRVRGYEDVAVIFGLSFCIGWLVAGVPMVFGPAGMGSFELMIHVLANLLVGAAGFLFFVFLVLAVGRMFGGKGTPLRVSAALAWHSLVTSFFTPFGAPEPTEAGGLDVSLTLAVMAVSCWPLGHFIAEAHEFRSTRRVLVATYAVVVGPLLILAFSNPQGVSPA